MRIIVVSDTHRNWRRLEKVVASRRADADLFIHLGDGEEEAEELAEKTVGKRFLILSGNCDFASLRPSEGEAVIAGKRIFYTHGHAYGVKFGTGRLISEAKNRKADILLFGHTHIPLVSYEDGLYILNPGSLGFPRFARPSYGVVDITGSGIVTNIVEI